MDRYCEIELSAVESANSAISIAPVENVPDSTELARDRAGHPCSVRTKDRKRRHSKPTTMAVSSVGWSLSTALRRLYVLKALVEVSVDEKTMEKELWEVLIRSKREEKP